MRFQEKQLPVIDEEKPLTKSKSIEDVLSTVQLECGKKENSKMSKNCTMEFF